MILMVLSQIVALMVIPDNPQLQLRDGLIYSPNPHVNLQATSHYGMILLLVINQSKQLESPSIAFNLPYSTTQALKHSNYLHYLIKLQLTQPVSHRHSHTSQLGTKWTHTITRKHTPCLTLQAPSIISGGLLVQISISSPYLPQEHSNQLILELSSNSTIPLIDKCTIQGYVVHTLKSPPPTFSPPTLPSLTATPAMTESTIMTILQVIEHYNFVPVLKIEHTSNQLL